MTGSWPRFSTTNNRASDGRNQARTACPSWSVHPGPPRTRHGRPDPHGILEKTCMPDVHAVAGAHGKASRAAASVAGARVPVSEFSSGALSLPKGDIQVETPCRPGATAATRWLQVGQDRHAHGRVRQDRGADANPTQSSPVEVLQILQHPCSLRSPLQSRHGPSRLRPPKREAKDQALQQACTAWSGRPLQTEHPSAHRPPNLPSRLAGLPGLLPARPPAANDQLVPATGSATSEHEPKDWDPRGHPSPGLSAGAVEPRTRRVEFGPVGSRPSHSRARPVRQREGPGPHSRSIRPPNPCFNRNTVHMSRCGNRVQIHRQRVRPVPLASRLLHGGSPPAPSGSGMPQGRRSRPRPRAHAAWPRVQG